MEELKSNNAGQGLGIGGLVLGIIAFIISFIPCLGMYAIAPGVAAIILSAIGLSQATKANAKKGLIIAALVISIIGTLVASLQFYIWRDAPARIEEIGKEIHKAIDEELDAEDLETLQEAMEELEGEIEDVTEEVLEDVSDAMRDAAEELEEAADELDDNDEEK